MIFLTRIKKKVESKSSVCFYKQTNNYFRFYSSKSLLIVEEERRRAEQEEFLRIEQGDDSDVDGDMVKSDDEDELARWEHEQIRKGVSLQKVV